MTRKLEVFFDYACPYCLRGHESLLELLPQYPQIEIVWCPCEAHPRPDRYGVHSDLCARGMFFALERGVDLMAYHDRMYRAALKDRADIEDPRDVSLLNEARENTEQILNELWETHQKSGRKTHYSRKKARSQYLNIAKQKKPKKTVVTDTGFSCIDNDCFILFPD